ALPISLLLQDEVGVHIAQLLGDGQGQVEGLPGGQGAEGALVIGVAAVEQAIQDRSFLSKKPGALLLRALGGVDRSQVIQFRPRRKRRSADAARAMGPGRRPCRAAAEGRTFARRASTTLHFTVGAYQMSRA